MKQLAFKRTSLNQNIMSCSISTLLSRNLQEVFGEGDPARRRAAIGEIYTEDGVFYDPNSAYRGRDEIGPGPTRLWKSALLQMMDMQRPPPRYTTPASRVGWCDAGTLRLDVASGRWTMILVGA